MAWGKHNGLGWGVSLSNCVRSACLCVVALLLLASSAHADGLDGDVVLLLHMDGTDADTTFTDSSFSGHTVTASNGAQVDTAQSQFGGASGLFDVDANLGVTHGTAFDFSGDFTVDFWLRTAAVDGVLFSDADINNFFFIDDLGGGNADLVANFSVGSTISVNCATDVVDTNTWQHIAFVRSGTRADIYVDGVSCANDTSAGGTVNSTGWIVGSGAAGMSSGHMDEFRVSNVARWTTNFTPPSEPYGIGGVTFTDNVQVQGDVDITGAVSKGSGTFVIDHPLKPKTHLLYHSFVESPDVKNLYDGIVALDENGEATIELPGYFLALNKDIRYLGTPIGEPMPNLFLKGEVKKKWFGLWGVPVFTISGGAPHGRVSWQVTGIRHDPYILARPIIPEVEKSDTTPIKRGKCVLEELCE